MDYRYLIIGGGMTADAAVRGIRELDSSGSIGIVGTEQDLLTHVRPCPRRYGRVSRSTASGNAPSRPAPSSTSAGP
jgi:hypothetical protein